MGRAWTWRGALLALVAACLGGAWLIDVAGSDDAPGVESGGGHRSVGAASGLGRYVLTARWGHTTGPATPPGAAASQVDWSGELILDCGAIAEVEPLAMEPTDGAATEGLGAIEQGPGRAQVRVRSRVGADWDGLRAVVIGCGGSGPGAGRPRLSLQLGPREYTTALLDDVDSFVTLEAPGGQALEVRVAAELDPKAMQGSRVVRANGESAPTPFRRPEALMATGELTE